MEYTANGIITLSPASKTRLSSDVSFISPSKAEVTLSSKSDEELSVLMKLEAENDAIAQEFAIIELGMICDLLSFYHNTVTLKSGITGVSCTTIKKGYVDVSCLVKIGIQATASVVVTLGDKSLAKLTSNLRKHHPVDCREAIYMWRDAISKESSVEKFFFLYRLMEYLFDAGGKTGRAIDEWIKTKDSSVRLFPKNKYRDYEHTVYTYLRDNVHYKAERKQFPLKEIEENLLKFQTLVHQKIEGKYGIQ
jgi:hypothetical protein